MFIDSTLSPLALYTRIYDKETNKDVNEAGIYLTTWDTKTKKGTEQRVKDYNDVRNNKLLLIPELYLPNCKTVFIFSKEKVNSNEFNIALQEVSKQDDVEIVIC